MPLFIASIFFLLHLRYHEGTTGFELVTWLKEAGPVLTSHVRRLQVNFGVSWLHNSRTVLGRCRECSECSIDDFEWVPDLPIWPESCRTISAIGQHRIVGRRTPCPRKLDAPQLYQLA